MITLRSVATVKESRGYILQPAHMKYSKCLCLNPFGNYHLQTTAGNPVRFFCRVGKVGVIIIIIKGHSLRRACLQPATNTQNSKPRPPTTNAKEN